MEKVSSVSRVVRFGAFAVDLQTGELRKHGVKVRLQQKPFQILATLLERPRELVTREELRKRLWPGDTFVDFEQSLATAVKKLRQALGDSPDHPRFIETLPRRGYRFIGIVDAEPRAGRVILAVLPFENSSANPKQEYFSDGMTEEVIAQLGRLNPQRLGVIARASAMHYRDTDKGIDQIGRELGADYILKGRVRRVGDRVRVAAELIKVTDQTHLWAETYERDWADVLAIQGEVARRITHSLAVELLPAQQATMARTSTANPEAHEAFLKGRYSLNKGTAEGFKKAIEHFEQATSKDPGYAVAHAGLATAYDLADFFRIVPARQAFPKAKAAAIKALELNEMLAEAHNALAFATLSFDWDWAAAERIFMRAFEINPHFATARHWYGFCLGMLGRVEDALREIRRALELDPFSLIIRTHVGLMLYRARRYDEAVEQFRQTLEMEPRFAAAHYFLGWACEQKMMYKETIRHLQTALVLSQRSPDRLAALGHAYAVFGKKAKAQKVLEELRLLSKRRFVSAYDFAILYAGLGEKDQAFGWLEKAYEERSFSLVMSLKAEPRLDNLQSDPRFQDLVRRVGLPA
jgi:TolB-like protein/DNA-binding winged helix-turn-helix (wHTH) protein/Flp pilus assembly protein TadD